MRKGCFQLSDSALKLRDLCCEDISVVGQPGPSLNDVKGLTSYCAALY